MNIFEYQNFRLFLGDYLNFMKDKEKGFSQRAILKKMGISSTGFLANVISGRNNLTEAQAATLGDILGLKKREKEYFETVVFFTQAKTIEEKNKHFEKMIKIHKSKYRKLSKDQMGLFAKWHYAVVREIIALTEFKGDYKALAKMVKPKISETEAKNAIEMLEKIDLIKKDSQGIYRQHKGTVTTGDEVKSLQVSNFLLETMKKAELAMDNTDPLERDISELTLKISENKMKEIKSEIRMFRKKLLQLAEQDTNKNSVYQCNINFFPVSEKVE